MKGATEDAAERARAEAQSARSAEGDTDSLLRLLIKHTPAAIAMFDREMRYLEVSDRWIVDYHLRGKEVIGRSHYEVFPDIPDRWKAVHRRVLAGAVERCDEDPFPRADGTLEWLEWEVRPWRTATGDIGGLVMLTQVITERKQAESERARLTHELNERVKELTLLHKTARLLQEERPVQQALFDDFVGLLPAAWQFPEVCEAKVELAGFVSETSGFRVSPWMQSASFTTRQGQSGRIEIAYLEARPEEHEGPFLREERSLLQSLAEMLRVYVERKQDEVDRRALERQLQQAQKMEAVGRLAAGVAHDFNNVLSAITMSTEILVEDVGADHPSAEILAEIRKASDRAAALTRQLLAFSRQQVLEPRVIDLNDLVTNLERMLQRLIGADIAFETRRAPSLGAVRADPGQLEQVILNLVVNARDAMPNGGSLTLETENVSLDVPTVSGHGTLPAGCYVALSVSDTGIGIDAATKARMFEPFFTTKEQGKGTGLGLAMVYGIVQQSGGIIDVESDEGKGARFRILFPRVSDAIDALPAKREARRPSGTATILVVEDDRAVRLMTRKTLARLGYRVLDAGSAAEAAEIASVYVDRIDLLLTDLVMPGVNGRVLAMELAERRPGLRVLLMSGYTGDPIVQIGALPPGFGFIAKPFSASDLAERLDALLAS